MTRRRVSSVWPDVAGTVLLRLSPAPETNIPSGSGTRRICFTRPGVYQDGALNSLRAGWAAGDILRSALQRSVGLVKII
jgi:hypothetical protein